MKRWITEHFAHFSYQLEIHKYSNGDHSEEYDKYFNSDWRILCFSKTSKSESVDSDAYDGKVITCYYQIHQENTNYFSVNYMLVSFHLENLSGCIVACSRNQLEY